MYLRPVIVLISKIAFIDSGIVVINLSYSSTVRILVPSVSRPV